MNKKIENIPTHIAFIMDGNRRWAQKRGLNRMVGHRFGANMLKKIILALSKREGIKYASFFAFSTENWNRDQKEIDYLFDLLYEFFDENSKVFNDHNIKFKQMGDLARFPKKMQEIILKIEKETENNTGLVVNMALNYGGRADIVQATNKLLKSGVKEITDQSLAENLYSFPAPDIDLLVRTSGENRISNFMLYQMAYSEFYFAKKYWPEFNEKQLEKALIAFSKRNRRFGGK